MANCTKIKYPNPWAATHAFQAIALKNSPRKPRVTASLWTGQIANTAPLAAGTCRCQSHEPEFTPRLLSARNTQPVPRGPMTYLSNRDTLERPLEPLR